MLRTRRSGSDALVDVHIQVNPRLSVSEGHQIGESVRGRLLEDTDEVTDVTVHIDPEDDEFASPCTHLPLRDEILHRLEAQWQSLEPVPQVEKIILHYLDGKAHVDVYLPLPDAPHQELQKLARAVANAARQAEDIGDVQVYFGNERAPLWCT